MRNFQFDIEEKNNITDKENSNIQHWKTNEMRKSFFLLLKATLKSIALERRKTHTLDSTLDI